MSGLIPSATAVIVKQGSDSQSELQVLLLQRNQKLATHGGSWVFPGGKIDLVDFNDDLSAENIEDFYRLDDAGQLATAQRAAIREAHEEAGIMVDDASLKIVSRWITPEALPKRFDAWFFMSIAEVEDIVVDGSEIHDYQWISPAEALRKQQCGEITLPPPTYVTLKYLLDYTCTKKAIHRLSENPPCYRPKLVPVKGGFCSLYEEDAGYAEGDIDAEGIRHRLVMIHGQYDYHNNQV